MKVLEQLKRTLESLEDLRAQQTEDDEEFAELFEKYSDIPAEKLKEIIADIKAACVKPVEPANEDLNDVDVKSAEEPKDAEHTDTAKSESTQVNELDASEDEQVDDNAEDLIVEDDVEDSNTDDLIVEGDEDELELPSEEVTEEVEPEVIEDENYQNSEMDEDFDGYEDELDIAQGDEEEVNEDAEKIDMNIPSDEVPVEAADKVVKEDAEKIDMSIPSDDTPVDAADKAAKEQTNEANIGAKAAIANREAKGNFSSDVDALTDYLNDY